jgi:Ca2+-binding EF-hand superfamily protein
MRTLYTTTAIALALGLGIATPAFSQSSETQGAAQPGGQATGQQQTGQQQTGQQQGQQGQQPGQQGQQGQQAGQQGQQARAGCPDFYAPVDVDMDERVSMEEDMLRRQEIFRQLDANTDNAISQDEFMRCFGQQAAARQGQQQGQQPGRQAAEQRTEERFSEIDQDGNDEVSHEEYMNAARQAYEDAAGEGEGLDAQQYEQAMGPFAISVAMADRDGDGKITQDEASAAADRVFDTLDQDGDDTLTQTEWTSQPGQQQMGQAGQQGQERAQQQAVQQGQQQRAERVFSRLDTDGDDRVSFVEFMTGGEAQFRRAQERMRQQMGQAQPQPGQEAQPGQPDQPGQQARGEQVQVELVPVWVYRVYYLR